MNEQKDRLELNITEATERACKEPTLLDALQWICIWESERIVKQARANPQGWETCFKVCLQSVLDNLRKDRPDREKIEDAWWWQGDGEDHLESLTCLVLIEAQQLRDLLEEAKKQERKDIGLELQLALSKMVNKPDFNEYRLSEFITIITHKLIKGQSLKETQ